MTKTDTKQTAAEEEADATEKWLDSLDPAKLNFRDASHVRGIMAAAEDLTAAEDKLRQAVAEARAAGDSWTVIGVALGVSKQAAQQRFRGVDEAPAKRAARGARAHYGLADKGSKSR